AGGADSSPGPGSFVPQLLHQGHDGARRASPQQPLRGRPCAELVVGRRHEALYRQRVEIPGEGGHDLSEARDDLRALELPRGEPGSASAARGQGIEVPGCFRTTDARILAAEELRDLCRGQRRGPCLLLCSGTILGDAVPRHCPCLWRQVRFGEVRALQEEGALSFRERLGGGLARLTQDVQERVDGQRVAASLQGALETNRVLMRRAAHAHYVTP